MNRPCSKSRWTIALSLLIVALAPAPAVTSELSLRAFTASYSLYEGGMHIANAELSLRRQGEFWHWRMLTTARGVYSWFTDKRPYSETIFSNNDDEIRLQQIVITDGSNKKRDESARFDWENGKIDVMRKGKQKQLNLSAEVYDYQSIHLLAAAMSRQQIKKKTIDFYRNGKLVKSRFLYGGKGKVAINGKGIGANIYEQIMTRSDSKMKYYYDAENPMLPLRIEKLKAGESPTILTLQQVDWTL